MHLARCAGEEKPLLDKVRVYTGLKHVFDQFRSIGQMIHIMYIYIYVFIHSFIYFFIYYKNENTQI